jgi:hypothetical protein
MPRIAGSSRTDFDTASMNSTIVGSKADSVPLATRRWRWTSWSRTFAGARALIIG